MPRSFFLLSFLFIVSIILSGCSSIGGQKPAALQVTSTPEASVFLDGKHLGKTPYFSDQLKAGEYTLKITASEATYIEKVNLNESRLTVVNRELNNNYLAQSGETLWLESGKKGVFVVSLPQDADLTIDGALVGKTPYMAEDIKDGDHKLVLSKAGFADREFSIKTSGKYQLVSKVNLASLVAKGQAPSQAPPPLKVVKVEVEKTPQGFLRIRAEPSLSGLEVGKVNTGDQLEVIQEVKDWTKIKFGDKQGWISAQYTKKI